MAGRRRLYSVPEVLEMVYIPNGALSDTESISDDKIAYPDYVETPEAYESDSSFDEDEPLADIARTDPNQLDVEIHHAHADSDIEAPDDNEPQPGPAPVNKEFSWRQRKPPAADIDSSFQGPAFSTPPDEIPSPRWYFDQFMDKSVFEHISHQSNLYAIMKRGPELKTTPAEMEQFIGLHILMTIVRMPSYRMYWQTATRYDPIATVMGRKRFDHLRTYIHMNDNTNMKQKGEPGYDPLYKVRPVLEKVRANCLKVEPEENHAIDEQMIPFKGNLRILYYLIDLSLVNGWLLYRRHLTQKKEKKHMPLLDFRAQVADALIKVGKQADFKSRKRGRPSLEDSPEPHQAEPPLPPLQRIVAPSVDVRLDRVDHFPIHAEKRGRCRLCKDGYTQTACLKCKVLLCFTKTKNCFMDYHTTK